MKKKLQGKWSTTIALIRCAMWHYFFRNAYIMWNRTQVACLLQRGYLL